MALGHRRAIALRARPAAVGARLRADRPRLTARGAGTDRVGRPGPLGARSGVARRALRNTHGRARRFSHATALPRGQGVEQALVAAQA
jgi:hypothetical protein